MNDDGDGPDDGPDHNRAIRGDTSHVTPERAVRAAIAWTEKTDKPTEIAHVCLTCGHRTLQVDRGPGPGDSELFCGCTEKCPRCSPSPTPSHTSNTSKTNARRTLSRLPN